MILVDDQGDAAYLIMLEHIGHKIVAVGYGPNTEGWAPWNTAIECEDCNAVLFDASARPVIDPEMADKIDACLAKRQGL